jgi:hypothetical protein
MLHNIDLVYNQYIGPLPYEEKAFIVQRILQDFVSEQKKEAKTNVDKIKNFSKFKGISKNSDFFFNEEDWYQQ